MQQGIFIRGKGQNGLQVDSGWSGRGISELNYAEGPAKGAEQGISAAARDSAKALKRSSE